VTSAFAVEQSHAVRSGPSPVPLPVERAELPIGRVDDPAEHEADRIAARVLSDRPSGLLQRACACGGAAGPDGECAECRARRLGLQRSAPSPGPAVAPAVVHDVLAFPGRQLDPATRSFFEARLEADLSAVRIHTGPEAARSAASVDARAYTVGSQVVFGPEGYSPTTPAGRRLLAHELVHVAQQRRAAAQLRRTNGAPAPTYGPACGTPDPCEYARCTNPATIQADLTRAIGYVDAAVTALNASPLAADTVRGLDWFFNDHSAATVTAARTRLQCIRTCLADTQTNNRFGCHPDDENLAYVCVGSTPICTDALKNVCYTSKHVHSAPRVRAQSSIHECAHRVGMSLGRPRSVEDIYRFTTHFLYMDTEDLLRNSDSFALFAGAIAEGVRTTVLLSASAGYGFAAPAAGASTWQFQLYAGAELQRPVFSVFNPTFGIGATFIGESTGGAGTDPSGRSLLASLRVGLRVTDPRPGAAGGGYVSVFGGPALAVPLQPTFGATTTGPRQSPDLRLGAEAGVAVGYRWRWIDLSGGIGYAYDPTRAPGAENLVTGTLRLTFSTGDVRGE
jgi:Domain of unknown function (DUF4157)